MWNNLIGQAMPIGKLKSSFTGKRVAHSYIFYGLEGVGKDAAAIEFAKLLNCTNLKNGDEACDVCENCKKISEFRSELFHFICALPSGRSEQTGSDPLESLSGTDFDKYLEQLKLKSQNPYYKINIPNANNIRINSIRDLVSKIYLSTPKGSWKAFVISGADKMRIEASNALLKVLEEPPRNSVIILTTSKINSLPATIIGRCQSIHFDPLEKSTIRKKLAAEFSGNFPENEFELASRLGDGSYTKAHELLAGGIDETRNNALAFLVSTLKNDYANTILASKNVSTKNDRERVKQFLSFLTIWFRDLLRIKCSGNTNVSNELLNIDLMDRLIRFSQNYPSADIFSIISEIEESEKMITQNVQLPLILVNLSFKLKELISKQ